MNIPQRPWRHETGLSSRGVRTQCCRAGPVGPCHRVWWPHCVPGPHWSPRPPSAPRPLCAARTPHWSPCRTWHPQSGCVAATTSRAEKSFKFVKQEKENKASSVIAYLPSALYGKANVVGQNINVIAYLNMAISSLIVASRYDKVICGCMTGLWYLWMSYKYLQIHHVFSLNLSPPPEIETLSNLAMGISVYLYLGWGVGYRGKISLLAKTHWGKYLHRYN